MNFPIHDYEGNPLKLVKKKFAHQSQSSLPSCIYELWNHRYKWFCESLQETHMDQGANDWRHGFQSLLLRKFGIWPVWCQNLMQKIIFPILLFFHTIKILDDFVRMFTLSLVSLKSSFPRKAQKIALFQKAKCRQQVGLKPKISFPSPILGVSLKLQSVRTRMKKENTQPLRPLAKNKSSLL